MPWEITVMTEKEIKTVYSGRLKHDFPRNEVKPLRRILKGVRAGRYRCYALTEGEALLAYAFLMMLEGHSLLDYYAVRQDLRGTGIGSRFLRQLCEGELKGQDCVLLETEDPEGLPEGPEKIKREQRLRFYLKNGMRDTGVRTKVCGADYQVLQMPVGEAADRESVIRRYTAHYRAILPGWIYARQVAFRDA